MDVYRFSGCALQWVKRVVGQLFHGTDRIECARVCDRVWREPNSVHRFFFQSCFAFLHRFSAAFYSLLSVSNCTPRQRGYNSPQVTKLPSARGQTLSSPSSSSPSRITYLRPRSVCSPESLEITPAGSKCRHARRETPSSRIAKLDS